MTLLISPPAEILVVQPTPPVVIELINAIVGKPGKDGEDVDPTLYYTKTEVDTLLNNLGVSVHDHNLLYYTKDEIGGLITEIDDRHYDKVEIDFQMDNLADLTAAKAPLGHTHENYVEKEEGKSLISDSEIVRLSTVTNFDESALQQAINDINSEIGDVEAVLDAILGGA